MYREWALQQRTDFVVGLRQQQSVSLVGLAHPLVARDRVVDCHLPNVLGQ